MIVRVVIAMTLLVNAFVHQTLQRVLALNALTTLLVFILNSAVKNAIVKLVQQFLIQKIVIKNLDNVVAKQTLMAWDVNDAEMVSIHILNVMNVVVIGTAQLVLFVMPIQLNVYVKRMCTAKNVTTALKAPSI